jgi:hypothetical protein
MTHINIHNFHYFLKELEKGLDQLELLIEQESIRLANMRVLHNVMDQLCSNWLNEFQHQK